MRFCYIVEAQYKNELMPMSVAIQLMQWGHEVDVLEPQTRITCLSDMHHTNYDAYVLKTVSDGPGLSILEAAEAAGIPTINHSSAIRQVRDKTIATTRGLAFGLPIPRTYFIAHPRLLQQVPEEEYPLVVKPTRGSSCRSIYRISSPYDPELKALAKMGNEFFLAQHYVENCNFDIKLYVVGTHVTAIAKRSPLHPEIEINKHPIPLNLEMHNLALRVGEIFGLDIYGLDIVVSDDGPMIVDINDFPSFGQVPDAIALVAAHIIEVASQQVARRLLIPTRERLTA